jgi:hypothetical protein
MGARTAQAAPRENEFRFSFQLRLHPEKFSRVRADDYQTSFLCGKGGFC